MAKFRHRTNHVFAMLAECPSNMVTPIISPSRTDANSIISLAPNPTPNPSPIPNLTVSLTLTLSLTHVQRTI